MRRGKSLKRTKEGKKKSQRSGRGGEKKKREKRSQRGRKQVELRERTSMVKKKGPPIVEKGEIGTQEKTREVRSMERRGISNPRGSR